VRPRRGLRARGGVGSRWAGPGRGLDEARPQTVLAGEPCPRDRRAVRLPILPATLPPARGGRGDHLPGLPAAEASRVASLPARRVPPGGAAAGMALSLRPAEGPSSTGGRAGAVGVPQVRPAPAWLRPPVWRVAMAAASPMRQEPADRSAKALQGDHGSLSETQGRHHVGTSFQPGKGARSTR
jgi:hypothetical protein